MHILVIDVGGTHVKILIAGQTVHRQFSSGPTLTAKQMVARVKKARRQLAIRCRVDWLSRTGTA